MKKAFCFLKRVASSRVGNVLLILHLSLVIFDFAQKPPVPRAQSNIVHEADKPLSSSLLLAGRSFHWHYESALLKFLILVDLPGIFVSLLISVILIPLFYVLSPLGAYDESWFAAGVFLLGASIQWQFLGYWLERVIQKKNNTE